ncbi:MAG: 50S ribosomal protein L6 [Candidatus Magasanikbacteria bacterium GW2011_GWA2_56_11]|uniref:50S ribosomal protein L6 n=1 Tax=Candidatus Magasanikbacteria bacterium GW2011_GWA2_56_11 TaxID=1619044 RepID=A0A0G2B9U2_9BACT|nr:MAG: 50S ribosomal protein L6 [Candidatus Magasanikbacteria bacterium GW2011_GWA2_56_11]
MAVDGREVTVKGPKGELKRTLPPGITVAVSGSEAQVSAANPDEKAERSLWGTLGAHLRNMVKGVTAGFSKQLEINGVGYRVAMQGKDLKLEVGYSHPVVFAIPAGVQAAVEKNLITLSSIDKELLGNVAAELRSVRRPEPYKGKGIKYVTEVIRRKAGKAASKGA